MAPFNMKFDDVVEVFNGNSEFVGVNFKVWTDPPVQLRPKIAGKRITVIRKGFAVLKPFLYDPSGEKKNAWKSLLKEELSGNGVNDFPLFPKRSTDYSSGLKLVIEFYLPRRKLDYHQNKGSWVLKKIRHFFPHKKDLDNMLKFAMDAMEGVVFENDQAITVIQAAKYFVDDLDSEPYTTISVEFIE